MGLFVVPSDLLNLVYENLDDSVSDHINTTLGVLIILFAGCVTSKIAIDILEEWIHFLNF